MASDLRFSLAVPALENSSSSEGELGDTTAVVIVHSPRAGRKKRGTPRTSIKGDGTIAAVHAVAAPPAPRHRTAGAAPASDHADPCNFLLAGGSGARALDGERAKAQAAVARAAARDLRGSNAAAAELARVQAEREREVGALRGELLSLAGRFKAEQERLVGLRERLAEECRGRAELEAAHQERVKDLHKRLQAEHLLRVNAELDAGRAQDKASNAAVALKGLEQQLEGLRAEAAELREGRLGADAALNKERLAQAGLLAEVEALKTAAAREKHSREAQQRKCGELEASLRSLSAKNGELQEDLRAAQAAADAATQARAAAEAAARRQAQDVLVAQEQLEAARRGRDEAAREAAELQERVAGMEASTAIYIAKEAHYDDLKAEHDEAQRQLEERTAELAAARKEARAAANQLGDLSRQAAKVPQLSTELEQTQQELQEVHRLLGDTQAAFKLLVETVREKEAAAEELEGQVEGLRSEAEAARRQRDEAAARLQEKDAELGCARQEAAAAAEEATAWQRRCKGLQGEADEREVELARRDLRAKELEDALQLLCAKGEDEAAAAAADKRRLEGVAKSLEGRLAQAQSELARSREELSGAEQGQVTARAEIKAVQDDCARLRAQLNEEQVRASKLRSELAALGSARLKEQQDQSGLMADALARLQEEESGKLAAQQEAKAMRRRADELEAALSEAAAAKARADDAYAGSQAALESMKKKLEVYKRENANLLSSYDTWLKQTMAERQPVVGASP